MLPRGNSYLGEGRKKTSQNQNDVGFTGHQKDNATGLTYMQARYYDPTIGRFYGIDPAPFSNVQNFNRFVYANNNPYKYVDTDGQASKQAMEKVVNFAKSKSPQTMVAASTVIIGTQIAIQVSSDKQDPSKVMGSVLKANPVIGTLTSIPGVGEILKKGLDDILNPTDSNDMTDEQLQEGNFDGRIRVKDMDKFSKRAQKAEPKNAPKELKKSEVEKMDKEKKLMFVRIMIVCFFFLILPLIGIAFQIFGDYILLTKWEYFNVLLSILFSLIFSTGNINLSKTLGGMLFISIFLQDAKNSLSVIEWHFSTVFLEVFVIPYKLVLGSFIFYFLFKPTFKKGNKR